MPSPMLALPSSDTKADVLAWNVMSLGICYMTIREHDSRTHADLSVDEARHWADLGLKAERVHVRHNCVKHLVTERPEHDCLEPYRELAV